MILGKRQDLGNPGSISCAFDELRQRIEMHRPHQLDADQRFPQAVVLAPIIRSGDPELVLALYAVGSSTHGDEAVFPGGWRGSEDADLMRAALRGAEGEVTLPPGLVEVVGSLSTLVSRRGIEATPYVAPIPSFVEYQPNDGEIAAVSNVPLNFFRDDPYEVTRHIDCFGRSWYVPNYRFGESKIWGPMATTTVGLVSLLYDDPIDLHILLASLTKLS